MFVLLFLFVFHSLVDGIGQLSRMHFGTAVDSDEKDLLDRYTELVAADMSTNKMVRLNLKNTARLNHSARTFLNYTNQLSTFISEAFARVHEQYTLHEDSLLLNALETYVTPIMHTNELILRNVVDAS